MQNIILCGFMGCGKTTVGKLLSQVLEMEYIDLDAMIEETAGKPIPQIFSEDGEEAFRDLEHEAVLSLGRRIRCVVSTGGGAMTYERNARAVSPDDRVVFLDVNFPTCYQRIRYSARPLVRNNPQKTLEKIFQQRRAKYLQAAAITVDGSLPPLEVAQAIQNALSNR